jgi:hypothetical protein
MVRAGIVLTEVRVDEGVVRRLVVDPQEEELSWLKIGLELKGDGFERDCTWGERFRPGCDCTGERAHLAVFIICKVFIDNQCWH